MRILLLSALLSSALAFQAPAHPQFRPTALNAQNGPSLLDSITSPFSKTTKDEAAVTSTPTLTQKEQLPEMSLEFLDDQEESPSSSFSYATFAQENPFANNIMIATFKTAAADLLAQTVIAQTPLDAIDWQRSFLFCAFGATYLGGFQYLYQVNIFKKLFDVDKFTSQSWGDKLQDKEGLKALAAQTALDLGVLTAIYLPTFYIFKASVFTGSLDPSVWVHTGIDNYQTNFAKDEFDLIRVWLPADLVCFSVPLYLRLPVRHVVSFVWTAYLSFSRGGH
ncbi:Mpv17 / PMP22 family [Seminavis robusta]|uniref:Mpv17 / PMP22 family n=1 Tax=Seminavis robusta TaxID=568900 RepID=A0A9N8DNI4_9STRA|nr:Mpv17 / PMP22 family [Seminavis robusta]|eukprot:Sro228_g092520.1 Mpv17 / PMP22 family (279) ;mRNA; r:8960-9796